MGFINKYPYTDFHELNLDWVIESINKLDEVVKTFVDSESIKFADPIQWDITTQYLKATVVINSNGVAFLSKQAVPSGIGLDNTDYWLEIFNFIDYVKSFNSNITFNVVDNTDRAPSALSVDDWLLWNDILYKVTSAIAIDDTFIVKPADGYNIERFTIEQFCRTWQSYMVQKITQYKNEIDASELQYKNAIDASELLYRQQLAQDIADTTANLQAQLDAVISGATVDSEVIDARVGADNVTYATLGEAIRTQFTNTNDELGDVESSLSESITVPLITGKYISASDGSLVSNVDSAYTEITVKAGEFYRITTTISNPVRGIYAVYDANDAVVGTIPAATSTLLTVTEHILIPSGGVTLRACRNSTNNPIVIEKLLNAAELDDTITTLQDQHKLVDVTPTAVLNYYVNPAGALVSNASSRYIEYWNVAEGDKYIYSAAVCVNVRAVYVFYDGDLNVISALPAQGNADITRRNYIFTIPANCVLMRLSMIADSNGEWGKLYKFIPDETIDNDHVYHYGCQVEAATGYGNMGRIYTTNAPVGVSGILSHIKVTVNQDGQMDFYRMKRNVNAWYWYEWIGSYPVTAGVNYIDCFAHVDAGDYIATFDNNSCKIGYNANLPWNPGIMFDTRNFNSNYLNIDGTFSGALCLSYDVVIPSNKSDYALISDRPSGILYKIDRLINADVTATAGWSHDIASRTADSYIYINKKCWEVDFHDHIMFTLENGNVNTTVFDVVQPEGGFFVRVDLVNNRLTIHKPWSGDVSDAAPAVLATRNFNSTEFPLTYDRRYELDIHVEMPRKITVTLTDSVTLASISFDFTCTGDATVFGVGEYPLGVILRSGFVWLKECYTYTGEKISPLIQIYGDSYSLGFNLIRYGYDYKKCWSYLLKDYFDGDVTISARGGKETSDAVPLLESDLIRYRPKYIVFELGINENLDHGNVAAIYKYKENMTYFVEAARKVNAVPILVTVPRLNGAGIGNSIDSFLRNYKINLRVFDMGAVLCYDDISYVPDYSQGWYLPDSHPSVSGNKRMFDRFILDFNDLTALDY